MSTKTNDIRPRHRATRAITASVAAVGVVALLSTAAWRDIEARDAQANRPAPAAAAVSAQAESAQAVLPQAPSRVDSYAPIVDEVAPAVVTILSEKKVAAEMTGFPDDPLFRQFFGDRLRNAHPRAVPERGLGSGVVIARDGYILTNNHVVDGAESIKVELKDGRSFNATLVGTDPPSDLALLKIDAGSLPVATLGDSDGVRVGDVALAIGNPLGIGQTVTMGIVSAKGRATGLGDGSYEDFIQTDAPINQGNSGGALVNTRGQVIGINSQILSPSGGSIGIGFSIPSNMAKNVVAQLRDHGAVRRAKLGVTIQPVTSDIASSLGLTAVGGALVNSVDDKGPAAAAGIEQGDVITRLNGKAVEDTNALRNEVASMRPGSKAELTVLRNGSERQLDVTLGEMETEQPVATPGSGGPSSEPFGMSVRPLTPEIARQLDLDSSTRGLVVTDIDPVGPAADAGLQRGDVIVLVNGRPVTTPRELRSALERATDRPALLLVNRGGQTFYVPLRAA